MQLLGRSRRPKVQYQWVQERQPWLGPAPACARDGGLSMHLNVRICAALAAGAALALPCAPSAGAAPKGPVVAGYFAQWDVYGRGYHPKDIPAEKLTHVIYAF